MTTQTFTLKRDPNSGVWFAAAAAGEYPTLGAAMRAAALRNVEQAPAARPPTKRQLDRHERREAGLR